MKIKFIDRFSAWLYNVSHEKTISDFEIKIRKQEEQIGELEAEKERLKKLTDAGLVEAKIIRTEYNRVKCSVSDLVDYSVMQEPQAKEYAEMQICKQLANEMFESGLISIIYEDNHLFSGMVRVIATANILTKGESDHDRRSESKEE